MLTQVEVTTSLGNVLTLPLQDTSQGYSIRDISGLDPVKATIVSSSYANVDGEQYHHSRREARNIVFKLGLEANFVSNTVSGLRAYLYKIFMPKTQVSIRFWDVEVGGIVDIQGRVESFECPLFTAKPEATISIICGDPDFISPEPTVVKRNTFGAIHYDTPPIDYTGTVDTGLIFTFLAPKSFEEVSLTHKGPDGTLSSMDYVGDLATNDLLLINTNPGSKQITVTRAGTSLAKSELDELSPYSNWIRLHPGSNRIELVTDAFSSTFEVSYYNRYGGL